MGSLPHGSNTIEVLSDDQALVRNRRVISTQAHWEHNFALSCTSCHEVGSGSTPRTTHSSPRNKDPRRACCRGRRRRSSE